MTLHIREISSVDLRKRVLTFYNKNVEKNIREDTSYSMLPVKSTVQRISNEFLISKPCFKYMDFSTTYQLSTLAGTKNDLPGIICSIEKEQYIS